MQQQKGIIIHKGFDFAEKIRDGIGFAYHGWFKQMRECAESGWWAEECGFGFETKWRRKTQVVILGLYMREKVGIRVLRVRELFCELMRRSLRFTCIVKWRLDLRCFFHFKPWTLFIHFLFLFLLPNLKSIMVYSGF